MLSDKHKEDWESLAKLDPFWAILTDSSRQFGRWDLDEFFQLGETEMISIWQTVRGLGFPKRSEHALDFGCGVGRLTRPLGRRFRHAVGVDISAGMIQRAVELHRDFPNLSFQVNAQDDLGIFESSTFDMIYTNVVLQHLPTHDMIFKYIGEFGRVLASSGILVFQLPSHIPWPGMLQPRRRLFRALRRIGFSDGFLYARLRLNPMRMTYVPEATVRNVLKELGLRILQVEASRVGSRLGWEFANRNYFCSRCE